MSVLFVIILSYKLIKLENQFCVVCVFRQSWPKKHFFFWFKKHRTFGGFWSMVCGVVQVSGVKMILRILID